MLGRNCGQRARVATLGFLILGDDPIVVDTGFRSNEIMATLGMRGLQNRDQQIENQLGQHGLKLRDVRYILYTRCHRSRRL